MKQRHCTRPFLIAGITTGALLVLGAILSLTLNILAVSIHPPFGPLVVVILLILLIIGALTLWQQRQRQETPPPAPTAATELMLQEVARSPSTQEPSALCGTSTPSPTPAASGNGNLPLRADSSAQGATAPAQPRLSAPTPSPPTTDLIVDLIRSQIQGLTQPAANALPPNDLTRLHAPTTLYGRAAEEQWLFERLAQQCSTSPIDPLPSVPVIVSGLAGGGKTALIATVLRRLQGEGGLRDGLIVLTTPPSGRSAVWEGSLLREVLQRVTPLAPPTPFGATPELASTTTVTAPISAPSAATAADTQSAQGTADRPIHNNAEGGELAFSALTRQLGLLLAGKRPVIVYEQTAAQLTSAQMRSVLKVADALAAVGARVVLCLRELPPVTLLPADQVLPLGALPLSAGEALFTQAFGRDRVRGLTTADHQSIQRIVHTANAHPLTLLLAGAYATLIQPDLHALSIQLIERTQLLDLPVGLGSAPLRSMFSALYAALDPQSQTLLVAVAAIVEQLPASQVTLGQQAAQALAEGLGITQFDQRLTRLAQLFLLEVTAADALPVGSDRTRLRLHPLIASLGAALAEQRPAPFHDQLARSLLRFYTQYVAMLPSRQYEAFGPDADLITQVIAWARRRYVDTTDDPARRGNPMPQPDETRVSTPVLDHPSALEPSPSVTPPLALRNGGPLHTSPPLVVSGAESASERTFTTEAGADHIPAQPSEKVGQHPVETPIMQDGGDDDVEQALATLIAGLYNYWHVHSLMGPLHTNLAIGQRVASAVAHRTNMAEAWARAALFDRWRGDWAVQYGYADEADHFYQDSLRICQQQRDERGVIDSLLNLAQLAQRQGQVAQAEQDFTTVAQRYARHGDWQGEIIARFDIGTLLLIQRRQRAGRAALARVRTLLHQHGHEQDERATLLLTAGVAFLRKEWGAAADALGELETIVTRTQSRSLLGMIKFTRGMLAFYQRHYREAIGLLSEGIAPAQEMEQTAVVAQLYYRRGLAEAFCRQWEASEQDLRTGVELSAQPGGDVATRIEAEIALSLLLALRGWRFSPISGRAGATREGNVADDALLAPLSQHHAMSQQEPAKALMRDVLMRWQAGPHAPPFDSVLLERLVRWLFTRYTRR